jgi:hypothetical protein
MILRRLTTALRKQDWFTVVIETLIVVFGVFIGLQVNNWNAARVERNSEQVLLLRLQEETRSLLGHTERRAGQYIALALGWPKTRIPSCSRSRRHGHSPMKSAGLCSSHTGCPHLPKHCRAWMSSFHPAGLT